MKLFEKAFLSHLSENSAGAGGVFGGGDAHGFESMGHGGAMTPATDFYAHDDARTPMPGKKTKKSKINGKRKFPQWRKRLKTWRRRSTPSCFEKVSASCSN